MGRQVWDYGADDRYPVVDGDIWEVGPHWIVCGDLERGDLSTALQRLNLPRVQMIYTDPPWGAGAANAFRTKAQPFRGGGEAAKVEFPSFLRQLLAEMKQHSRGDCYMEMGRKWHKTVLAELESVGGAACNMWPIIYYRKYPAELWRLRFDGNVTALDDRAFHGMDDDLTPKRAIEISSRIGDLIMDPLCGRGLTLKAALELERRCVGFELHPKRISVTLSSLYDMGCSPKRIDNIRT